MLLFAVAIAVIALLFYDFVSRIGLNDSANAMLLTNTKLIGDQLGGDVLCSFKSTTIPDRLIFGINNNPFYYDLQFSKSSFGEGDEKQNILILRVAEHKSNKSKENIVAAKSIETDAEIVLVDTNFLQELSGIIPQTYNVDSIFLYPRAASRSEVKASSPNAFVALKEIKDSNKTLYIIPCAIEKEPNNCIMNILRVGCYKLKTENSNKTNDTLIDSCFNVSIFAETSEQKSSNFNWGYCKEQFPEIANS